MKNDIIKIYYDVDETGQAEHLGDRLACIVDVPLLSDEVFVGDIVRLCHDPDEDDGLRTPASWKSCIPNSRAGHGWSTMTGRNWPSSRPYFGLSGPSAIR